MHIVLPMPAACSCSSALRVWEPYMNYFCPMSIHLQKRSAMDIATTSKDMLQFDIPTSTRHSSNYRR
jgi:hypothetical protein